MPRIICRYDVCVFNKNNVCTSKAIEYDPDQGCLTAQDRDEFAGILDDDDDWEEDEELEPDDEAELDDEDDEDDDDDLFAEDEDEPDDEDDL